jgi:uncharacterized protein
VLEANMPDKPIPLDDRDQPVISRRTLIATATVTGFGLALTGSREAFARPNPRTPGEATGYGPLVPDIRGVLSLPVGFSYVVVAQSGMTTTDDVDPDTRAAFTYPSDPDGMGVFVRAAGGSILVSNHEISATEPVKVPRIEGLTYDAEAVGGTSTVAVDDDGHRLGVYTSLAGTDNNCAGGITPWGTWLTCEETERTAGTKIGGRELKQDHGYVFEVDPASRQANLERSPRPLTFLGRYSHEAVAVDPDTLVIYLTEDAVTPNGLYYRWTPPAGFRGGKGALHELAQADGSTAGRLQAMSCRRGRRQIVDLSEATEVGTRYRVHWVDVPDRLAMKTSTRLQPFGEQVTRSRKLEGQWWGNGGVYFVASFARPEAAGDGSLNAHDGQVWFYDPNDRTVTLKTLFKPNPQPEADGTWDGPDNITVSPHGGLIVAEDGAGKNHLVGVGRRGDPYPLARNDSAGGGEFCGPSFSSDGRILFTNIQSPTFGATLAITGPWHRNR